MEHLGSCFAEDALRKTQVRVSLVHLRKKREEPKFSFDTGLDEEGAAVFSDGSRFEDEVATRDFDRAGWKVRKLSLVCPPYELEWNAKI